MTAAALITTKTGYDLKIKIQYDAQHKIKQGITLEETTPQNQTLILINNPGENKEYPTLGCAIKEITNDNQFAHYKQLITQQLEQDGQTIEQLIINQNGLTLEAHY